MADLDPQVQIRIIDLADKWAENLSPRELGAVQTDVKIKRRAETFDQAFKAIVKTVAGK